MLTDRALAWLDGRPKDRPFLLMVNHKAPHLEHDPAPRHARLLEDVAIPEPSTLFDKWDGRAPSVVPNLWASRLDKAQFIIDAKDKAAAGDNDTLRRAAYEAGINLFDGAETHALGNAEEAMGRAIAELGWPCDTYSVNGGSDAILRDIRATNGSEPTLTER